MIDRQRLVSRHNIRWNRLDGIVPIGNGEFCFGADATGLQSYAGFSMAHWGWHSFPLPDGWSATQVPATGTFQHGSNTVPDEFPDDKQDIRQWMFDNPHRMKLGRLLFCNRDGGIPLDAENIAVGTRELDLWQGIHTSRFTLSGEPVEVVTVVHPDRDLVAVNITSSALARGALQVALVFEYPTLKDIDGKSDVEKKGWHETELVHGTERKVLLRRSVDTNTYEVALACAKGGIISKGTEQTFRIRSDGGETMSFSCEFAQKSVSRSLPSFEQTRAACVAHWQSHWMSGGAIDLSGSRDPRWKELERRIVLSQYHMAAQSAGSWPAPEIGLMGLDPWRGQFHMEMIWWHLAHYALWNRWGMAEQAAACYRRFMPTARQLAAQLGYKGAMWPKSVGPEGRSAPWGGNFGLLWKQPHPIFLAELAYRLRPTQDTLETWSEIIEGTAELMADYPVWDEQRQCYSLTPCVPPSETGKTRDGVFDIVYWRWGLSKAQEWRERLGLPRHPHWDDLCGKLADLPSMGGIYVRTDEPGSRHNEKNYGHPDPVGVYGMLPLTDGVDPEMAKRTTSTIWQSWQWQRCWGWDFPWTAMAAARTGQQQLAVDALLRDAGDRNRYDEIGLNQGGPCPYLPGNGGLLYAVAMMAAGWDGCADDVESPGFPQDGYWTVQWEGLNRAI